VNTLIVILVDVQEYKDATNESKKQTSALHERLDTTAINVPLIISGVHSSFN